MIGRFRFHRFSGTSLCAALVIATMEHGHLWNRFVASERCGKSVADMSSLSAAAMPHSVSWLLDVPGLEQREPLRVAVFRFLCGRKWRPVRIVHLKNKGFQDPGTTSKIRIFERMASLSPSLLVRPRTSHRNCAAEPSAYARILVRRELRVWDGPTQEVLSPCPPPVRRSGADCVGFLPGPRRSCRDGCVARGLRRLGQRAWAVAQFGC
jgi:hypothetical protein